MPTLSRGPRAGQDVRSYDGLKWDGRRRLGSPGLNGSIISASHGVYLYISGKRGPRGQAAVSNGTCSQGPVSRPGY